MQSVTCERVIIPARNSRKSTKVAPSYRRLPRYLIFRRKIGLFHPLKFDLKKITTTLYSTADNLRVRRYRTVGGEGDPLRAFSTLKGRQSLSQRDWRFRLRFIDVNWN